MATVLTMTTGDRVQLTDAQTFGSSLYHTGLSKKAIHFCLGFGTPLFFGIMPPAVLHDLTPDWRLLLSLTAGDSLSDRGGGGDLISQWVRGSTPFERHNGTFLRYDNLIPRTAIHDLSPCCMLGDDPS
jgi:hypothetical protein